MPALGPNISAHRCFQDMWFVAVNSKYSLISNICELGIFNERTKPKSKMSEFSSLGPRRLPHGPNIFPLANEFDKGKIFWNGELRVSVFSN